MVTQDQIAGCLLGLALGDAMGAPYEGGLIERFAWKLIGKTRRGKMRWTDDTQMSLDVAESLLINECLDPDHLAHQFAKNYRWSRGYGPAAAKILKKIKRGKNWEQVNQSIYPEGSFGNGGAMRAPVIGAFFNNDQDMLINATKASALITHAHPLGIEGAVLIALATSLALNSNTRLEIFEGSASHCKHKNFTDRLTIAGQWLRSEELISVTEVVKTLGNGIAAEASCVTALYISLRFMDKPFIDMMNFVIKCGGDVDTIGAMAGAVWGSKRGASNLPQECLQQLEELKRINDIAISLSNKVIENQPYNEKI